MIVLGGSVSLRYLNAPTENEKLASQWQRQVMKEKDQMTRDMLVMRDNITQRLRESNGMESGDLTVLRRNLEIEHRKLKHSALEYTAGKSNDTWGSIRERTLQNMRGVQSELSRFQGKAEKVAISLEP